MSKNQHLGKLEERKIGFRKPDLGYYYIVTDAVETEPNFFNGIKNSLPVNIKGRLVIKIKVSKTYDMVDTILSDISKRPIVYDPWIVFDKDQVRGFDELVNKAKSYNINVAWSNPCIEILFLAYFGKSPNLSETTECIREFEKEYSKKVGKKYAKNNKDIYRDLIQYGNEEMAIKIMSDKYDKYENNGNVLPSRMTALSMLYKLLLEIGIKVNKNIN